MSKAQANTKKNLKDEESATLNKKQKVGEDEGKKVAQKNKKVQSDSESEEEVVIVPTKKNDNKAAGKAAAATKKGKADDSDTSSAEEDFLPKGKATNGAKPAAGKAPAAQNKKPAAKKDSSDDESDKPATKKPAGKPVPKVTSDDEESSEEEVKPATKKGAQPAAKGKAAPAAKKGKDSDDESDEPVKPQKTVATSSKAPAKKVADSDDDSDDAPKKPAGKPAAKAPAKKAIESEESEEEKAPAKKPAAKKAIQDEDEEEESQVKTGGNKGNAGAAADGGLKGVNEVFVGNLPWTATEGHITEFFSACGEVAGVNLLKGYDGKSKGIAFVRFTDEDGCNAAVEQNGADYDGRALKVEKSTPKEQRAPREGGFKDRQGGFGGDRQQGGFNKPQGERDPNSTTIFVGNLAYDTSADTLRSFFESCGAVKDVRIAYDRQTQQPRGFGHVEFASTDSIDKAMAKAGQKVDGRPIRVDFSGAKKEGGAGGFGGQRQGGFGGGRGGYGGGNRGGYEDGGARKGSIGTFAGNKVRL